MLIVRSHRINQLRPVIEVCWRKNFIYGVGSVCLVYAGLVMDELLEGLPAHRLVKSEHKVVVKLLFSLLVQHIVALEEGLLWTEVVFTTIDATLSCGRVYPLFLAGAANWSECFYLLYDSLSRINL